MKDSKIQLTRMPDKIPDHLKKKYIDIKTVMVGMIHFGPVGLLLIQFRGIQLSRGILFFMIAALSLIIYLCLRKIKGLLKKIKESNHRIKILNEAFKRTEEALMDRISELEQAKSHQVRLETYLKKEQLLSKQIMNNSNILICVWNTKGQIIKMNGYMETLTGYSLEDFIGKNPLKVLIPRSHQEKARMVFQTLLHGKSMENYEGQVQCKDGRLLDILWNNSILHQEDHLVVVISTGTDMTQYRQAQEKIYQMAYYDPLTGLPNRMLLEAAFKEHSKALGNLALLYFDLDNFKVVNDTLGHVYGDALLKDITAALLQLKGENDLLARLGGDEFALLMNQYEDPVVPIERAQAVVEALEKNWVVGSQEFYISGSIGIALYPEHGTTYQMLLKNADTAMYVAKGKGKNCYELFERTMADKIVESMEIEKSLRYGIKNKEFLLYYQPQYDLKTEEITGMEALIRWNHPFKGMISPYYFISAAERTGLIRQIGRWVIYEACSQSKQWRLRGLTPAKISINLSAIQMKDKNFIEDIKSILKETGAEPKDIEFEITEHAAIENFEKIILLLHQLREMNFKIALDDFGTGYSSLNYLKLLPIDYIKIDRSFVENVTANLKEQAITKSLIKLAQEMNLKIIAEGIETEEQRQFLRNIDCNGGQGYLFGRPVPAKEMELKLRPTTQKINEFK